MGAPVRLHRSNLPALPAGSVLQSKDSAPVSLWRQLLSLRLRSHFTTLLLRIPAQSERSNGSVRCWFSNENYVNPIPSGRAHPPGPTGFSGRLRGRPFFSGPGLPHHRYSWRARG